MIRIPLLICTFFIFGGLLLGQDKALPNFRFEVFELPGGELGNHVQTIAQDSFGFMWFGSQFGLHRWDGYQLKTYYNDPEDSTSILSNYIEYIYVAKDGALWLGHWGYGLDRFDYATETFHHFVHDANDPTSLGSNYVSQIMEDLDGYFWVSTHQGVYRLDLNTGIFKGFLHDPSNPHSLSYDKCRVMLMDTEGTLWFGTGYSWEYETEGGLNRYRPETEDFVRYLHDPDDPNSLSNNKVSEIFEDSKGNFWVGTIGDGLHLMDRNAGRFQRLQKNSNNPIGLYGPFPDDLYDMHIRNIFEDQHQKLWISAWHGGIKYYDPETGYEREYYHDDKDPESLPENFPWTIFQSRDGTLWGCTAGANGSLFKIKETIFDYHPTTNKENSVHSFGESRDQKVWIGTDKNGLLKFDPATKEQIPFNVETLGPVTSNINVRDLKQIDLDKNNLLNSIAKIVEDKTGRLWLKKWETGLIALHPKTGELKIYKNELNNENSIGEGGVTDLFIDEKDRLWVLTTMGDLNLYDPEADHFIRYKYADPGRGFYYHSVLAPASDGKLWIAGSGLNFSNLPLVLAKFDPETNKFAYVDAEIIADDPRVKLQRIYTVEEDYLGNIWIASETRIKKINPNTKQSTHFGAFHFGSLFFLGMTIDEQDRLWLFGDKISLFDTNSGIKSSFETIYDFKSLTNYSQPFIKHSNGSLYVGGKGGFQIIDPNKIGGSSSPNLPETILVDFQLLNKSEETSDNRQPVADVLTTDIIRLNYDQNAFSFRFAAINFHQDQGNRHHFKLEGYDEEWRSPGLEPKATYVKVPPGEYTFKVRGASHNSDWGPEKTISVFIASPWWATGWAYMLYVLAVVSLIFSFYRFQLARQLAQAEAQRLKELDTAKTLLYTNITHEFRTPLTVILGMARQVLDEPKLHFRQGMNMIIRNGENLLSLVNQMLDLSKLESGKLSVHLQQGDIIAFLKYLAESFRSFAESRGIQVHFLSDLEHLSMDYDPKKIQQIFLNLLSNAVKFTPPGGHVYIRLAKGGLHADSHPNTSSPSFFNIIIRDTGSGIPEEKLPFIFDRFYQVDDSMTREREGSGIGLALTKELVKLMEGSITAKSQIGEGTTFFVALPIRQNASIVNSSEQVTLKKVYTSLEEPTLSPPVGEAVSIADQQAAPSKNPVAGYQILLVEDNPDVVQYLTSCLAPQYRLHIANDGQEGIDLAKSIVPDLIISDIMMPKKDGFEVCDILKNDKTTSHIPIIMLTAKADVESKLEGLQKGADAYLAKPFNKEELLVRIRKLLELRQKLQQHYLGLATAQGGMALVNDPDHLTEVENYFIKKVREVVEKNMDNFEFSVEVLCREIGMSNSQLHRKLTALTGLSATKFIRYIRLNHSKELLQDHKLSIMAVAFDTGFNDPSYFGRVFKKEFGETPMEWRERIIAKDANA